MTLLSVPEPWISTTTVSSTGCQCWARRRARNNGDCRGHPWHEMSAERGNTLDVLLDIGVVGHVETTLMIRAPENSNSGVYAELRMCQEITCPM